MTISDAGLCQKRISITVGLSREVFNHTGAMIDSQTADIYDVAARVFGVGWIVFQIDYRLPVFPKDANEQLHFAKASFPRVWGFRNALSHCAIDRRHHSTCGSTYQEAAAIDHRILPSSHCFMTSAHWSRSAFQYERFSAGPV
jgi:hypothetical protein